MRLDSNHPVDVDALLGARIRDRRRELKIRQIDIAAEVGVSCQQFQKYEGGASRLSAQLLVRLARILDVHVSYFFDDLPHDRARPLNGNGNFCPNTLDWLSSEEGREFATLMSNASPRFKTGFLALAQLFAVAA